MITNLVDRNIPLLSHEELTVKSFCWQTAPRSPLWPGPSQFPWAVQFRRKCGGRHSGKLSESLDRHLRQAPYYYLAGGPAILGSSMNGQWFLLPLMSRRSFHRSPHGTINLTSPEKPPLEDHGP